MININELEKVITSGKIVTLVIMVDGKELAAISFTLDTVAFKEILETVVNKPVIIADKQPEKKTEVKVSTAQESSDKKAEKAIGKKELVDKHDKTKTHPEFNPIPATKENIAESEIHNADDDDRNFDDNGSEVDTKTGEIKEKITPHDINTGKSTVSDTIAQEKKAAKPAAKVIEPVTAAAMESDDIIPEQTIVTEKKETANQEPTLGEDEKW